MALSYRVTVPAPSQEFRGSVAWQDSIEELSHRATAPARSADIKISEAWWDSIEKGVFHRATAPVRSAEMQLLVDLWDTMMVLSVQATVQAQSVETTTSASAA